MVLHRNQCELLFVDSVSVHVPARLQRSRGNGVYSQLPFDQGIEGAIGDAPHIALGAFVMSADYGDAEASRENAHHSVEDAKGPVPFNRRDVLAICIRGIGYSHAGDRAAIPEIARNGDDVIHIVLGDAGILQGFARGLENQFCEGFLFIAFIFGLADADYSDFFHSSLTPRFPASRGGNA